MRFETYRGDKEKLVICIDVGTTASAVSYAHLVPGGIPKPETVSQWPSSANEMKVPSALYYDEGKPKAFCAETEDEFIKVQAEDGNWELVKDFKLLLHPSTLHEVTVAEASASPVATAFELPTLPQGLSIVQLYADLYKYLVKHTGLFFSKRTIGGQAAWNRLLPSAIFIVPHPDGWRDAQQQIFGEALAAAGLVESSNSRRIEFVRESEASVHWVLSMQHSPEALKPGAVFTVVDAGGSTVDTAMLQVASILPKLELREVKASDCIQAGGLFVTRAGRKLIETKLLGSGFDTRDLIDEATQTFETSTKRRFDGTESNVLLKLGIDATVPVIGLRRGRLMLATREVEERCFDYFVRQILASVERQSRFSNLISKSVLVVGGFGESPYLQRRLKAFFEPLGIEVVVTSEPTKKAVSEGGVIYYLKKSIVARAVRSTYGISLVYPYNANDEDHLSRGHVILPDRSKAVRGGFSTLVAKDTVVGIEEVTILPYSRLVNDKSSLAHFEVDLYAYDGEQASPKWLLDAYGNILPGFNRVGTIRADLSPLKDNLIARRGAGGETYYSISFAIGLTFGANSLKAKLMWNEGDVKREGLATIILSVMK